MPPPRWRHGRTAESDGGRESLCKKFHAQAGAISGLYPPLHAPAPPAPGRTDMKQYFQVTPPSVHQMVLMLERQGFITRQPRTARSIELLVDPQDLPELL